MERLWSPGEDQACTGLLDAEPVLLGAGCSGEHDLAAVMCVSLSACNHCHPQWQRGSSVLQGVCPYNGLDGIGVKSGGRCYLLETENSAWVIASITTNSTRPSVWARYLFRVTRGDFFYYMVLTSVLFLCWGSTDYESYHCAVMGRAKGREAPVLQAVMES